jgi:amidase
LIKDNIATQDKMNNTGKLFPNVGSFEILIMKILPCSAGSYALLGAKVPRDSTVVEKLRAAGAIILGKETGSDQSCSVDLLLDLCDR